MPSLDDRGVRIVVDGEIGPVVITIEMRAERGEERTGRDKVESKVD